MKRFALVLNLRLLLRYCTGGRLAISHFMAHWFRRPPVPSVTGKPIEVEFRDVIIDNINGNNFRQNVPYTITCDPDVRDDAWEMSAELDGQPDQLR